MSSKILKAAAISVHVCEHRTVTYRLHDADGAIFATASMDLRTAISINDDMIAQASRALAASDDDTIGKCEGHA